MMCTTKSYKYIRLIFALTIAITVLCSLIHPTKQIKAKEEIQIGAQFSFRGEYGRFNNLRYGLGSATNTTVPNVELADGKEYINHIYKPGNIGDTSSSFGLGYQANDDYTSMSDIDFRLQNPPTTNGMPIALHYKGTSDGNGRALAYIGEKDIKGRDIDVELVLGPSENNQSIKHEFSVTNNSGKVLKLFPTKQVDTMLGDHDDVPIYSRGPGKGLYIESEQDNGKTYRLDYITNLKNGPKVYQGETYNRKMWGVLGAAFNDDFNSDVRKTIAAPKDEVVFADVDMLEDIDTGIFLSWGTVVLQPGEKWTGRYDVGIKPADAPTLEIQKEAKNTNGSTINKVGDIIQYTVQFDYASPSDEIFTDAKLMDKLPDDMEKPIAVKLKKTTNELKDLNVNDVYNEQDHTISVNLDRMHDTESVQLIYDVKIKPIGAGKVLENTATISGKTSEFLNCTASVTHELEVDGTTLGKVTIFYEDSLGNQLSDTKEFEGEIGTQYKEEPIAFSDWIYYKTEGNSEGFFTETSQTVKFKYMKQSEALSLKQFVFDSSGNSIDSNKVKQGAVIQYKLELSVNVNISQEISHFVSVTLQDPIDENLEVPTELRMEDSNREIVGEVKYDEHSRQVIGRLTKDNLEINQKLSIEYKAKVKPTAIVGTNIVTTGTGTDLKVQTKTGEQNINDIESNQVQVSIESGLLEFVSAPTVLDFGQNLHLSAKDKVYGVEKVEGEGLVVQDNRGIGNKWQMGVNVKTDLTSEDEIDKLMNAFYYQTDSQTIVLGAASKIIRDETTQSEAPVVLSDDWSASNGVQLHIRSGAAKAKQYKGSLQWTLRDVPM